MEINKELLNKKIIMAKKTVASMFRFKNKEAIARLEMINKEVCLVVAEFKCQKCYKEKDLQIHHLILRKAKEYMDFFRYASQRYYWANQIVLCKKCHAGYHNFVDKSRTDVPNKMCIKDEDINKIKKKYTKELTIK